MSPSEKRALRERYQFRCAYCGVAETDVGAELTVDHFRPRSRGGEDAVANWVYCCHACNEFKGDCWHLPPAPRILHPQRDSLQEHLNEREDGAMEALTPTGSFHIERLHLNREARVSYRAQRRRNAEALQARQELLNRLARLEEDVQKLTDRIRGVIE